jgi:hypothetical protein
VITPWEERLGTRIDPEKAIETAKATQGEFDLSRRAKEAARRATGHSRSPEAQYRQAKSTVINNARAKRGTWILPEGVGKYSREIDIALPGKHTRTLYDSLKRREATLQILVHADGIQRCKPLLDFHGKNEDHRQKPKAGNLRREYRLYDLRVEVRLSLIL